jgi:hypothetical protein
MHKPNGVLTHVLEESYPLRQSIVRTLIAYEDFRMGQWAKGLFDRLQGQLDPGCFLSVMLWKFDVLRFNQLRDIATEDAAEAQLIVIAARNKGDLPGFVKAWIREWLPRKNTRSCALVALLEQPEEFDHPQSAVEPFLQETALRAHLDYFSFAYCASSLAPDPATAAMAAESGEADRRLLFPRAG